MSSLLLLFLPKLLRGTRDRWVAQVSFIIIHSTGLAPFPRLSAPPHSSQWRSVVLSLIHLLIIFVNVLTPQPTDQFCLYRSNTFGEHCIHFLGIKPKILTFLAPCCSFQVTGTHCKSSVPHKTRKRLFQRSSQFDVDENNAIFWQ